MSVAVLLALAAGASAAGAVVEFASAPPRESWSGPWKTWPSLPECRKAIASWMPLWLRHCVPAWTIFWYLRAASTILRPSQTSWLAGFST